MGSITGIIQTATIIIVSILALVAGGAGLYIWYTMSGQEEGE